VHLAGSILYEKKNLTQKITQPVDEKDVATYFKITFVLRLFKISSGMWEVIKDVVHFINSLCWPTDYFQHILHKRNVKKPMVYPGFEPSPSRLRAKHRHTKLPGCP
jgi:ABC-type uncharacterized transport system permease subunit